MAEVVALARAETAANVQALIRIRDAEDSPPAAVVAAVNALFDRAFGRPPQLVVGDTEQPITYVIRGPAPVASTEEWLALAPKVIDSEPVAVDAMPPPPEEAEPSQPTTTAWIERRGRDYR